MKRRALLAGGVLMLAGAARPALALSVANSQPARAPAAMLSATQAQIFREWMLCIVHAQLQRTPTPRWVQRDCAGLVRFAVAEALREHDDTWLHAMGLRGVRLPPPLQLNTQQQALRHAWARADGSRAAWVGALELVQENTRLVSRDPLQAQTGDLFFFDQGDAQHLMVWMGSYLAYHTGQASARPGEQADSGMRAYTLNALMHWRDTRWKPQPDNPNFAGVYRLGFLG